VARLLRRADLTVATEVHPLGHADVKHGRVATRDYDLHGTT